jgi:hypothetical protein
MNIPNQTTPHSVLTRLAAVSAATVALGAVTQASAADTLEKPAWLSDLSVGVKQSYDDNVFMAGAPGQFVPSSYIVPQGSVSALRNIGSWVTTVSPKIGVNVAPLLDTNVVQALTFVYSADWAHYYEAPSENYMAHRFANAFKGGSGAFSFAADNALTYVDGNNVAPTYPGGLLNAIGIATPRERREQVQDRASVSLRYDVKDFFIRPAASLLYYDMLTDLHDVTGYQNYCDRYEVGGGADIGYKVWGPMAVTLGYRYGQQFQQQFDFSPYSSSSEFQRVLAGIEGSPWKWLDLRIQVGPDFRNYDADTLTHITPVDDKRPVKFYGEGSLTAKISPKDAVTVKYRQFQWVSSLGKIPYYDSMVDLMYRRVVTSRLSVEIGGRIWDANYRSGNVASSQRDDWQYSVIAGLNYAFSSHFSASLGYQLDLGRNGEASVTYPQTRDYNRNLFSCGLLMKF